MCVFVALYKRRRTERKRRNRSGGRRIKRNEKEQWTIESNHVGTAKDEEKKNKEREKKTERLK